VALARLWTEVDRTVQCGQDMFGAVVVNWGLTSSDSTVTSVRHTVQVSGSRYVITV
jgi:hypothetical protein